MCSEMQRQGAQWLTVVCIRVQTASKTCLINKAMRCASRHVNNKRELHRFQFHGVLQPDVDQEAVRLCRPWC